MAPPASWKIEGVVLADAPAIARNNLCAFWPDPAFKLGWPNADLEFLIQEKTKSIPDDLIYNQEVLRHLKAVDPETGELLGYARYALPTTHTRTADGQVVWPEAQTAEVSAEERKRIEELAATCAAKSFDNGSDKKAKVIQKRILSEGTYIKLRYLAVHPDHQNKGVGTALVQSGIQKADEMGVDVYLMAYEPGRPVYQKTGFREIERQVEDLANHGGQGEYTTYFMLYDAKKGVDEANPA